jgi:hypothetical protein
MHIVYNSIYMIAWKQAGGYMMETTVRTKEGRLMAMYVPERGCWEAIDEQDDFM